MKKIFKKIAILCGVFLLSSSTLLASNIVENTCKYEWESYNNNLLLFVPENTSDEEFRIIYNNNTEEFPDKDIIFIKEVTDIEWTNEIYTILSLNSTSLEITFLTDENENIQIANITHIKELIKSKGIYKDSKLTICMPHKWNETLVGSTYKKYSKNISGWCYKMYQDIVRICKACDKTDEETRMVSTHYHDWVYGSNLGNYNYRCENCGMRK